MHDLVIKLDNLLHDRKLHVNLIANFEAKKERVGSLTLWERYTLFIARRTKREIDVETAAVINKMSTLTDTSFVTSLLSK